MAPVTRSSVHGRSVSREGSQQIPTEEDPQPEQTVDMGSDAEMVGDQGTVEADLISDDSFDGGDSFQDHQVSDSPIRFPSTSAQQILQPLQQTADRVSRQVEDFARRLDRFYSSRDTNRATLWKDALDLAGAFGHVATSRRSQTSSDLLQARHASRNRHSLQSLVDEGQHEVQKAQYEADLWELFHLLASFQDPRMQAEYAKSQKSCLRSLHRYSSASEIWHTFLSADQSADEYREILSWLHRRAGASPLSIDDVTKAVRHKADRGDGIWSAGWLFTKETIKTQKRNRSWPKPLDHSNPGLKSSHVRKSDSRPLVAQLDPDAKFREAAALEEQDEYHEQAAWMACWEMLRRGASAEVVRDWWTERKESWRAISMRGAILASLGDTEREWNRFTGLWRMDDWAASCYHMCRLDAVGTEHEAAVFGLLCGDVQVPVQVCQTIDDYLFVHFNAFLIERYREFGRALCGNEPRQTFQPSPPRYDEIRRLIQYCQHNEKTSEESRDPLKAIQSMIVSKDFDSFFLRQGRAQAQIANTSEPPSYLIVSDHVREPNMPAQITASDPDGLRIVAHQQLILKSLGLLHDLYTKHEEIAENNLTAYIGWLQQQGKMALIPLYASTLSPERGARVLGGVIMDVTDMKEREMMVNLMKRYGLDVCRVLDMQYQLNAGASGLKGLENPRNMEPISITEYMGSGKAKNLRVKADFIGEEVDMSEELLIRCVEWYRYGDKRSWSQTCKVASTIYKFFLCNGRLAAARALCFRARFSAISKASLKIDFRRTTLSDHGSEEEDVEMDGFIDEGRARPISHSKRRHVVKQRDGVGGDDDEQSLAGHHVWADQARTWRQLEELVEALDALEKWSEAAEEVEKTKGDPNHMRTMKKILQAALDDVRNAMYPLLEADFLSKPSDEAEAIPLTKIRHHYLPECILAYNSVLYFAGHAITRNNLVECMTLAQLVATNDTLTDAFSASSRMRELVSALALSSQALLRANERGGRKAKRDEGIEIWHVRPQDVGLSKES